MVVKNKKNRKVPQNKKAKKKLQTLKLIEEVAAENSIANQVYGLLEEYPIYFDDKEDYYFWNHEKFRYEWIDETGVLNIYSQFLNKSVIATKQKHSFLNSLKQISRRHKPKEVPSNFIQFKGIVVDRLTSETFPATPEYFFISPIVHQIGDSENTPTIDRLFSEWVGRENVALLYEILAFFCFGDTSLNRIIAFVGGGSNGKSTLLNLVTRFLGAENVVHSTLTALTTRNFETSALFGKKLCVLSEVAEEDLKNTSMLKALSGEESLRYEFKGKTPFTAPSSTVCVIATNALPRTPDKSDGFYRRWCIVAFPNQFPIKQNLLDTITSEEYGNLAKKLIRVGKELFERGDFCIRTSIEQRRQTYEALSNPLAEFIDKNCSYGGEIPLRDFYVKYSEWLRAKKLRPPASIIYLGKSLRAEGFETGSRKNKDGDSFRGVIGISWGSGCALCNKNLIPALTKKVKLKSNQEMFSDICLNCFQSKTDSYESVVLE